VKSLRVKPGSKVSLDDYDPADTGPYQSAEDAADTLRKHIEELDRLQHILYAEGRRAILIVLQGMDASGKDGTIRHVMSGLDPQGVSVVSFKVPNDEERAHDYLWRIHKVAPRYGHVAIFNRSHYEDVLAVRVHDLTPKKVWKKRFKQINLFEDILTENNIVILKFFLHVSKDEQKRRLEERLRDPKRHWKFSIKDVEERHHWAAYRKAYEDVLERCSTKRAPWYVVPADHKWYRNLVVAQIIVEALRGMDLKYPEPTEDLSRIVID
jgi:PPK2 family polyphosphate:nucleotide phosphotransferase